MLFRRRFLDARRGEARRVFSFKKKPNRSRRGRDRAAYLSGRFPHRLWGRAVLLTSPTAATVALTLTVPLAYAADASTGSAPGRSAAAWAACGAVIVVLGVIAVAVEDVASSEAAGPDAEQGNPLVVAPSDPEKDAREEEVAPLDPPEDSEL